MRRSHFEAHRAYVEAKLNHHSASIREHNENKLRLYFILNFN